jgi:hypothetical protein
MLINTAKGMASGGGWPHVPVGTLRGWPHVSVGCLKGWPQASGGGRRVCFGPQRGVAAGVAVFGPQGVAAALKPPLGPVGALSAHERADIDGNPPISSQRIGGFRGGGGSFLKFGPNLRNLTHPPLP